MSSQEHFDFSTKTIPDSWAEAAAEAPAGDGQGPSPTSGSPAIAPPRTSLDVFTACMAVAATSILGGVAWYILQQNGVTTPWLAVALGAMMAVAVRVGGGEDAQTRGVLALFFYVLTASVTIFFITRASYQDLYGSTPNLRQLEQELVFNWFTTRTALAAWLGGAFMANWGSKLLR